LFKTLSAWMATVGCMTEISDRYQRLSTEFTRRVEAVPPTAWDNPSPCEEWSARGVLQHVIDSHRSMPKYGGIVLTFEKSVSDDPLAAWVEARDAMRQLLDDPARAGAEYDGMFGRTSVEKTVDRFLGFDLLVHGWDIARATGQDETLPADEVRRVSANAAKLADNLRRGGVCGPEVAVPADADQQDRLLGLLGRTP
jgi:uncharacterized protein (TIGR03086 family)